MVGEKRWGDAREFYTKGIAALKRDSEAQTGGLMGGGGENEEKEKGKEEEMEGEEDEREKERKIEEACYVNRALCNLEMSTTPASSPPFRLPSPLTTSILTFHPENYRSTLHDTSQTLILSPTNTKAHFRSTLALLALNKHTLALDTCDRGLALTSPSTSSPTLTSTTKQSAEHTAFQTLKSRILSANHSTDEQERKRTAAEHRKKKEELTLNTALSARGIKMRWTGKQPDLEDARIHLEPEPLDPASEIHFPLLVLYPLHEQSDFLKSVAETSSFGEVLETVLGANLDWDTANEYRADGVEIFMETVAGGMVKVGRKKRVLDVLAGGKVEVLDGVVRCFFVPRGRVEGWVRDVKGRRGTGG